MSWRGRGEKDLLVRWDGLEGAQCVCAHRSHPHRGSWLLHPSLAQLREPPRSPAAVGLSLAPATCRCCAAAHPHARLPSGELEKALLAGRLPVEVPSPAGPGSEPLATRGSSR